MDEIHSDKPAAAFEAPDADDREAVFLRELDQRGVPILDKPSDLRVAEVLTWIGSALLLLCALVLIVVGIVAPEGSATLSAGQTLAIAMGVGVFVQAAVQIAGVYFLGRGRSGGRTVLTVVAVLNILVDIERLFSGQLILLLLCAYIVVTVALMWSRRSTDYLNSEREQRKVAALVSQN